MTLAGPIFVGIGFFYRIKCRVMLGNELKLTNRYIQI